MRSHPGKAVAPSPLVPDTRGAEVTLHLSLAYTIDQSANSAFWVSQKHHKQCQSLSVFKLAATV